MESVDDDQDPTGDELYRRMYQHGERLMGKPGEGRDAGRRVRPGPTVHPGGGWSSPPRSSHGRAGDGYPAWERGDYGHRLIDQIKLWLGL